MIKTLNFQDKNTIMTQKKSSKINRKLELVNLYQKKDDNLK